MAKINKVGHVVLNVSALDTSIAFYTAALVLCPYKNI
jgi:catechol 2,3-dioxygenase-like lactoylglutathione lyase family enzyme